MTIHQRQTLSHLRDMGYDPVPYSLRDVIYLRMSGKWLSLLDLMILEDGSYYRA